MKHKTVLHYYIVYLCYVYIGFLTKLAMDQLHFLFNVRFIEEKSYLNQIKIKLSFSHAIIAIFGEMLQNLFSEKA